MENIDDVYKVCSCAFNLSSNSDQLLYKKGIELRSQWIFDFQERHGPCLKIAYLDEKPVAQIQFLPEEKIPFIHDTRKNVVSIQCIYSPFPETQRKGAATALLKELIEECNSGLKSLGNESCNFIVTRPFPTEGRISHPNFYHKNGFKLGHNEMFLELNGEYIARNVPDFHPHVEDLGRSIIFFNHSCEWGPYFAYTVNTILQEINPSNPIEILNVWESPQEFIKRNIQKITGGRVIVNGQLMSGGHFWYNREAFIQDLEEKLGT